MKHIFVIILIFACVAVPTMEYTNQQHRGWDFYNPELAAYYYPVFAGVGREWLGGHPGYHIPPGVPSFQYVNNFPSG